MEEVTEQNIKDLIGKMPKESNAIERLVLCNEGTVQTLLSVLFKVPIKVEVLSQIEESTYIIRWSRLIAEYSDELKIVVCLAESVIDKNTSYNGFINGIHEKNMGIGQLISAIKLRTNRTLLGFYSDNNSFARTYTIKSVVSDNLGSINERPLKITITETFLKEAFLRLD